MKINIVSRDKRFEYVNSILKGLNYCSEIVTADKVNECDALVFSPARELSDLEISTALSRIKSNTVVFSGGVEGIKKFTHNKVIDYSFNNERFLVENANLTAEATVSYIHTLTKQSVRNKRILICGYGRIGRFLAEILSSLGAHICVFSRRSYVLKEILEQGYEAIALDGAVCVDIVLNTTPEVLFKSELIDKIPNTTYLIELASSPGGFEKTERVNFASSLPGKILTRSAGELMAEAIHSVLLSTRKDFDRK